MTKIEKTNQGELSPHTERNKNKQWRQRSGLWCKLQFSVCLRLRCILVLPMVQLQEAIYFPLSLSYVELAFCHNYFVEN